MAPDPWTAFTFFGIPFALGALGGVHGTRLLWRAYRRYTLGRIDPESGDEPGTGDGFRIGTDPGYSLREQILRGVGLLAVSSVLLVHSGRWLLSIYGYI